MEKLLEKILEDVVNTEGVTGCVVSDKQGLCLGSKYEILERALKRPSLETFQKLIAKSYGVASPESSGIITAISDFARKLHANEAGPTIVLENNEKQCIIQSNEKLVVSIYKNVTA